MRDSYMPAKQAEQVQWARNFSTLLNAAGANYGTTPAQAVAFSAVFGNAQLAFNQAQDPTTRTKAAVQLKNDTLKAMKAMAADLVSIIQGTSTVTNEQKVLLGITVRKDRPSPRPAPGTEPYLTVEQVKQRNVLIGLQGTKDKRSKAVGAVSANVFKYVGPTAPFDIKDWTFVATTTKSQLEIPFGPSATGDTVWITAFWVGSRGESGPASKPVSVNLPAGGALPRETTEEANTTVRRAA
jgi:hypothetical protein